MFAWCGCNGPRKGAEHRDSDVLDSGELAAAPHEQEKQSLSDEDGAEAAEPDHRDKQAAAAARHQADDCDNNKNGNDDNHDDDDDEHSRKVRFSAGGEPSPPPPQPEEEPAKGEAAAAPQPSFENRPDLQEPPAQPPKPAPAQAQAQAEPPNPARALSSVPEADSDEASSSPADADADADAEESDHADEAADKVESPKLKPNIHHKKFEFSAGRLEDKYEVTDTVLGSGAFGTVNLAYLRSGSYQPEDEVAVKMVDKSHRLLRSGEFLHEVDILSKIEHPSVVRLLDTYDTPTHIQLVMEVANGGELFDRIIDEQKIEERRVRDMVAQLTDAIAYLHAQGITHRDLKPENILFDAHDSDTVKVSDFGFAQSLNNAESMMQVTKKRGTMGYAAPEIFSGKGYDEKCDVWSLGIIVYIMLSGIPPFSPMDEYTVSEALEVAFWKHASRMPKVPTEPVAFPEAYFLGVSEVAKDWLRKALELDPLLRARSIDLLRHPWLKDNGRLHQTTAFSQQVVGRLKNNVNLYSSLR